MNLKIYKSIPFALPLALAIPATAGLAQPLPDLRGVVVYATGWGTHPKAGLYTLPTTDDGSFELLYEGPNGPSVPVGTRLYTINRVMLPELDIDYPRYTIYDLDSGQELYFKNCNWPLDWSIMPADMDIDPTTGEVYAITYNATMTGYQLSKLTFTDTDVLSSEVAPLSGNWNSMAFDASGQLYAISKTNGTVDGATVCVSSKLNKIDKQTGAVTPIGETGLAPEYISSATIDKASGRMFWTVAPPDGTGLLATVDLTTGAATVVETFPRSEEVVGLYVAPQEAAQAAPARAENLTLSFQEGSLTGSVSFDAPWLLYDGTAASGLFSFTIKAGELLLADGTASPGEHVERMVTLPEAGRYEIAVVLSNEAGDSPEARLTQFIGNGTPTGTYVRLTTEGNKMILNWLRVEESADGGYVNPSQVTYDVVRYPGGVKVAEGLTANQFSEVLPTPDEFTVYRYGVFAIFASNRSEESFSNPEALGAIRPPYSETFDTEDSIAGWKLIDANNDRRMWMWSTMQNLRISFNASNPMDDWIITPSLALEAGKTYEVSFEMNCDTPSIAEKAEVFLGRQQTPAAMTTRLADPFEITAPLDDPEYVSVEFTPDSTGIYYVGIHGISDADAYMLNFDNFNIKNTDDSSVSMASGTVARAFGGKGSLTVYGADSAKVFALDGALVGTAGRGETIMLPAGLYIVALPEGAVKVTVK